MARPRPRPRSGPGPVLPDLAVAVGGGRGVEGTVLLALQLPGDGPPVVRQTLHVTLQQLGHRRVIVPEGDPIGIPAVVILEV